MKKLIFLMCCCLLMNRANAKDTFFLSYINHTQNITYQASSFLWSVDVIADIGDSVSLIATECHPCFSLMYGPWYVNGDSIPNTHWIGSLDFVVTQAAVYHVFAGLFLGYYQFNVCPDLAAPPPMPGNIICQNGCDACPGDTKSYYTLIGTACATSYTWTPPQGTIVTFMNNFGITLQFTASFSGDTLRYSASNSNGSGPDRLLSIQCPSTVGILNPEDKTGFNLYPNPFDDRINIVSKNIGVLEVTVSDITSRKLLQQTFIGSTSLNTSPLSKGIYLYEVGDKNGVIKKGLVVKE